MASPLSPNLLPVLRELFEMKKYRAEISHHPERVLTAQIGDVFDMGDINHSDMVLIAGLDAIIEALSIRVDTMLTNAGKGIWKVQDEDALR